MNCPSEVAQILSEILQAGLLSIRNGGWSSHRSAIEADHLHNLPALLVNYSPDLLRFYWDVERPAYLTQIEPESASIFASHWKRLEPVVQSETVPALAH
jgi:hypothetical protein